MAAIRKWLKTQSKARAAKEAAVSTDVEKLLRDYNPVARDLALEVRALILRLVPDACEKVYVGWKNIGYSRAGGMKDQFCAIGPQKTYVSLYFNRGADLADPSGLLEGAGKKMRHVKIRSAKDVRAKALASLIKAAAKLTWSEARDG
jgi:hypothetical protein